MTAGPYQYVYWAENPCVFKPFVANFESSQVLRDGGTHDCEADSLGDPVRDDVLGITPLRHRRLAVSVPESFSEVSAGWGDQLQGPLAQQRKSEPASKSGA